MLILPLRINTLCRSHGSTNHTGTQPGEQEYTQNMSLAKQTRIKALVNHAEFVCRLQKLMAAGIRREKGIRSINRLHATTT